jgi:hypothetical protein
MYSPGTLTQTHLTARFAAVCCVQVGELHSTKGDLEVQLEDLRLENDHLVRPELDRLRDLKVRSASIPVLSLEL